MAFDTRLRMLQTQRMVMTPMLQQAISLLQLSRLELVQELRQHLEQNPVLEETLEEAADPQLSQEQEPPEPEKTEAEKAEDDRADRIGDFDCRWTGPTARSPGRTRPAPGTPGHPA